MSIIGLDLNDPAWSRLIGGRSTRYDPRKALHMLESGDDVVGAWEELWDGLHHQGRVDTAAYAAVPHLVRIHVARGIPDWNTYGLVATIENCRPHGRHPEVPTDLKHHYDAAWPALVEVGLRELGPATDPSLVTCILAVLAMGKGMSTIGQFAIDFTEDERVEAITQARGY